MLADRVRIGRKKGEIEYIGEVYLAQDDDFVKVSGRWIYRGSELEIEIPHIIQGEKVTSYDYMFYGTGSYLATPVTRVDSNNKMVTSMGHMFRNSSATTLDLSSFDTSNVTSMNYMFGGSSATTLDLSSFDTSSVTDMSSMFYNSKATTLDLSSFDTSNVIYMSNMFYNSKATTGYARTQADADKFNASSYKPAGLTFVVKPATDEDFEGTANGSFRYIGTAKVVYIPHVIKGVPVTSYNGMFDTDNGKLVEQVISDNDNVTTMRDMFRNSTATALDLSNFNTSNVTSMAEMFHNSAATVLDLSSFDTSNVTNMAWMFRDSAATELDVSSFNTSNVTTMANMFSLSSATTLDLSSFDTSSVTATADMFHNSQATTGYARTQADADKFNASRNKPQGLTFIVNDEDFGAPILTDWGTYLDKWTASSTGMGVTQVYDNMLYLSFSNYAGVGNSATFLSDLVKVSSDALDWRVGFWYTLDGQSAGYVEGDSSHGIPIGTIVKIGITFTCTQQEMQPFISARFELTLSIMDEDGELLVSLPITDTPIEQQAVSIEWLKFD